MYKFAISISVFGVVLLIWMSLGIGIIGEDGNPTNVVYAGVVAIGIIGTILSRMKPAVAPTLFRKFIGKLSPSYRKCLD